VVGPSITTKKVFCILDKEGLLNNVVLLAKIYLKHAKGKFEITEE
jgi:hypothetical protein